MLAIVGVPGSAHHDWSRVATRREGEAWASARAQAIRERHPAVGSLPVAVVSNRAAAGMRWPDGRRMYCK